MKKRPFALGCIVGMLFGALLVAGIWSLWCKLFIYKHHDWVFLKYPRGVRTLIVQQPGDQFTSSWFCTNGGAAIDENSSLMACLYMPSTQGAGRDTRPPPEFLVTFPAPGEICSLEIPFSSRPRADVTNTGFCSFTVRLSR